MNIQAFETYAKNPSLINAEVCNELQKITERYPYFHAAQTLFLKGLKHTNNAIFDEELAKRSIFLGNNQVILEFLTKEFLVETVKIEAVEVEAAKIEEKIEVVETANEITIDIEEEEEELTFENEMIPCQKEEPKQTDVVEEDTKHNYDEVISFEIEEIQECIPQEETQLQPEPPISQEKTPTQPEQSVPQEEIQTQPEKPLSLAETILLRVQQMKNNDAVSFTDTKGIEKSQPQNTQQTIIDKFLAHDVTPHISVENISDNQYDKSERSVQEGEYVTETMAKIYLQQKKNDKAIKIYEQLALQFPQKSVYFAQKISEIQNF